MSSNACASSFTKVDLERADQHNADVFEVVEKVAGEALKGGSVYTVLTLYVTIRNLLSKSSSWSTANVSRFSPAYCWK